MMEPVVKLTGMRSMDLVLCSTDHEYCVVTCHPAPECAVAHEWWVLVQVRRFEEYMYGTSERFAEKAEVNA